MVIPIYPTLRPTAGEYHEGLLGGSGFRFPKSPEIAYFNRFDFDSDGSRVVANTDTNRCRIL